MAILTGMTYGSDQFGDQTSYELLQLLLRSKEKAQELASKFRLDQLVDRSRQELGLTLGAFERLKAAIEIGRRIQERIASYRKPNRITSPQKAIEFCQTHFARLIADGVQEEFHIVTLDTKLGVINSHLVTKGTLDASLVHPREVFRPAIRESAHSIVLAHNHPSGDPEPSIQDISVTERLDQAGQLVGINIVDHIVMSRSGCVSIRESKSR